jgi:branched-chain amino acid transport system permease protein
LAGSGVSSKIEGPQILQALGQSPIGLWNVNFARQHQVLAGTADVDHVNHDVANYEEQAIRQALRCAENPLAASLVGIKVTRMVAYSYAGSALLGAMGGIIVTPITLMKYDTSLVLGLKGFVAFVIGGMGGAFGSFLGGIFLGVSEQLAAGLISSAWRDAIAFLIMLLFLFIRSSRIFNKP